MGEIYCIKNKVNGKCYVGQTVNTFERRYGSQTGWVKHPPNPILKKSAEKHGIGNFEIIILDCGDFSVDELNRKEIFWAEKLNSYHPNGFNLKGCGDNRLHHESVKDKLSRPVWCSNGVKYRSGVDAAKQLGLHQAAVSSCALGKMKSTGGLSFSYDGIPNPPENTKIKPYRLSVLCSNGKQYPSTRAAARDLGVDDELIRLCIHGRSFSAGGLRFCKLGEDFSRSYKGKPSIGVLRSDGMWFPSLKSAGNAIGEDHAAIRACVTGKRKSVKGFTFQRSESPEREA